jgi:hypothetical protein
MIEFNKSGLNVVWRQMRYWKISMLKEWARRINHAECCASSNWINFIHDAS